MSEGNSTYIATSQIQGEGIMCGREVKNPTSFTFSLPLEEARAFRTLCDATGMNITNFVRRAIKAYAPVVEGMARSMSSNVSMCSLSTNAVETDDAN